MRDGLLTAAKTVLVSVGVGAFVLGVLDLAVAPGEGRSLRRGALLTAAGVALFVPIMALAVRDAVREARDRRGRGGG